ncbi:MAG TPA: type II toxin-antitoxin system VapC family toxin [Candidatus Aquilonibacter sp.]|nr:type II toxin-antitoxin system VapC family toxin [Candidatus Aquilonibacter sp.]
MNRYLLDTCVISDARAQANAGLTAWLAESDAQALYLSVITVGEIAWGIQRLPSGKKRATLEGWLRDDLIGSFAGRLLSVDLDVAATWGRVRASAQRHGNNADSVDTLLAAIAVHHDLILVTRNEKDFAGTGAPVINPWSAR